MGWKAETCREVRRAETPCGCEGFHERPGARCRLWRRFSTGGSSPRGPHRPSNGFSAKHWSWERTAGGHELPAGEGGGAGPAVAGGIGMASCSFQACCGYQFVQPLLNGYICRNCGHERDRLSSRNPCIWPRYEHPHSPTVGSITDGSKNPIVHWFETMGWVRTRKSGIPAVPLEMLLGFCSYPLCRCKRSVCPLGKLVSGGRRITSERIDISQPDDMSNAHPRGLRDKWPARHTGS